MFNYLHTGKEKAVYKTTTSYTPRFFDNLTLCKINRLRIVYFSTKQGVFPNFKIKNSHHTVL